MRELILIFLPWILSMTTIYNMWLTGNKYKHVWLIQLAAQVLWFLYIFTAHAWGLLPGATAICFIALRNHFKWNQKCA